MLSDRQYDSRVRIGIITVITVLVFSPVIMAGSTNILKYIQDKRATSVSMVDEFQGLLDTDHPPFGENPQISYLGSRSQSGGPLILSPLKKCLLSRKQSVCITPESVNYIQIGPSLMKV